MAAKIVVTGFEPWEHGAANPTLEVLKQLDSANDIGGDLTLVRLPVDSNRIGEITSRTLDEVRPDLWISLGLAPGLAVVAIERITANVMDVHGALSHRQERNEGARRLHPCSGPSQPRGDSELSAGRNAVDER